jgi:hypothetical protein
MGVQRGSYFSMRAIAKMEIGINMCGVMTLSGPNSSSDAFIRHWAIVAPERVRAAFSET